MLDAQKSLRTGFLMRLSLPAAAIGFCLSAGIASTTWLSSTRYGPHIDNIAPIWLAGPLMGLLVQPSVGALSDRTWLLNGRRKPSLQVGGIAGAVSPSNPHCIQDAYLLVPVRHIALPRASPGKRLSRLARHGGQQHPTAH